MSTLSAILTLIKYLPDFIELAKKVGTAVGDGIDYVRIKRAMDAIDKDFKVADPTERARRINDDFRKV